MQIEPKLEPSPKPKSVPDNIEVEIRTPKSVYEEGDTIIILGRVSFVREYASLTIVITAPNGNIVTIDEGDMSSDGSFTFSIEASGSNFEQKGIYSVVAAYVGDKGKTTFELITEPEPESEKE